MMSPAESPSESAPATPQEMTKEQSLYSLKARLADKLARNVPIPVANSATSVVPMCPLKPLMPLRFSGRDSSRRRLNAAISRLNA
jgi:hypothetical protein